MVSYGVAVMEGTVRAIKMASSFPFLSRFVSFSSFRGAFEGTLPQFHMHAAQAHEIAAFFLLFSRSIAFKNALFQLIVLEGVF